jgi:hypothetical protein
MGGFMPLISIVMITFGQTRPHLQLTSRSDLSIFGEEEMFRLLVGLGRFELGRSQVWIDLTNLPLRG